MSSKPVVVQFLPPDIARKMFREADLARLRDFAEVKGPFDGNDPRLASALSTAKAIITGWGTPKIEAALLTRAPQLKLIAHSAGTVKWLIDDAVFDRGIRVTTSAGANAVPVAQYTLAMIVALLKQIPWLARTHSAGDRAEADRRRSYCRELMDIDVGLIGASRVGREVIKLLKSYPDVRIKLYDPYISKDQAQSMGVERVSLDDACRCMVVSIHAPNIPETRHMFNAHTLSLLPDHGVLINTARGALVDEAALIAEVRKRPLYVALDVTDPEPPADDSPLRTESNIILTPHIAGAMNQGCKEMGELAIDETIRFLNGEALQAEVTRAMMPTQA